MKMYVFGMRATQSNKQRGAHLTNMTQSGKNSTVPVAFCR